MMKGKIKLIVLFPAKSKEKGQYKRDIKSPLCSSISCEALETKEDEDDDDDVNENRVKEDSSYT